MRINPLVGIALFNLAIGLPLRANLMCLPTLAPRGVENPNVDDTCPADHNGTSPIGTFLTSNIHGATLRTPGPGLGISANVTEDVYQETGGTLDFYIQVGVLNTGLPPTI